MCQSVSTQVIMQPSDQKKSQQTRLFLSKHMSKLLTGAMDYLIGSPFIGLCDNLTEFELVLFTQETADDANKELSFRFSLPTSICWQLSSNV